ncbi:MAG: FtsX-like permease family protein [Candidatus Thorarchaeota archaeon]|jgi:ABC-type lipoprotein release transport system permease subunit
MSAIPVGYRNVHGLRRKGVSLLCILLASAMAMGILVYVDSYSVHEWDAQLGRVGPVAMSVGGINIDNYVDEIRDLPSVLIAESIDYSWGSIMKMGPLPIDEPWLYEMWGRFASPSDSYYESFPHSFPIAVGRLPQNNSEITLSQNVMEFLTLSMGDQVNYTRSWETLDFRVLTVVGVYEQDEPEYDYWYWYDVPVGIVTPDLLNPFEDTKEVDLEVDRTQLNPFNPYGSLAYLLNIELSIRELDPRYDPQTGWGDFWIDDALLRAVNQYLSWQMMTRYNQMTRAGAAILLVAMVLFLTIRHNVNERRYENNMLMSRGASRSDVERRITREVLWLSFIGTIAGLGVGILFSRFGLAATGFFQFSPLLFITEPFLVSLESILISVLIGMGLPFATLIGYRAFYSTKRRVEEQEGKLQKFSRLLVFIRWDVVLLILSIFFLLALLSAGPIIQYNPIFGLMIVYIPLIIFIALGSLSIKILRSGANTISRGMNRIVGVLPSMVGVRRIGKSASSAGPVVLVLVLSISIAWTYAIIGESLPATKRNQGRLAFGGDVAFHLGSYPTPEWNNFTTNVTNHELCAASSMVSLTNLRLSADYWETVDVMAINPEEYSNVGYDYLGNQLNGSSMAPLLETLESTPAGAIVTSDIATQYDLATGDTLRGFSFGYEGAEEVFAFTVIGIVDALSNGRYTDTGSEGANQFPYYWIQIGRNAIWVNRDYLGSVISLGNATENVLCVRTNEGANSTQLVVDVLEDGGTSVIGPWSWASVSYEVDTYTSQTVYQIDRAVDTMLTIATSVVIFGAFSIYAMEGITARKREIALLRSMGGDRIVVVKAQIAEMLILLIASLVLLVGYGPLHIVNTILTYRSSAYQFPVQVYMTIPWVTLSTVLMFFVGSVLIFIILVATLSSRVKIAESLNASWAESGPYGGDM